MILWYNMGTIWGGCMNKIIKFDSEQAVNLYCRKKAVRELGTGSEGTCYLGKDGLAYKDMSEGYRSEDYIPEEIITTADYQNKSFFFPHVLFVVGDELMGYTSDAASKNITSFKYLFDNGIDHINFDKLYSAYEVMYEDAIKLAEDGISIYDLPYNVVFDGERLIGIDTCGYSRAPVMECLRNPEYVDDAVKRLFTDYAEYVHDEKLDMSLDVKTFLDVVKKNYSTTKGGKPYIKQ